jgi:serine/threonine-protein kinase
MELLEGETLEAHIERLGRLTPAQLQPIVEDIGAGLAAAHAHGVIHGDLKPGNVFLIAEGDAVRAKLVDFGTSKVLGLDRLTRTGEVIGTPIYMAPELLTGSEEVSDSIDIYALGVLMFQALAGDIPFSERNPGKLLYQIVLGQGVALESLCPGVPAAIAGVVHKSMAAKRPDRYAGVEEAAAAFTAACA